MGSINKDLQRYLQTLARQALLDSGAFRLAPDGRLIEVDNGPAGTDGPNSPSDAQLRNRPKKTP